MFKKSLIIILPAITCVDTSVQLARLLSLCAMVYKTDKLAQNTKTYTNITITTLIKYNLSCCIGIIETINSVIASFCLLCFCYHYLLPLPCFASNADETITVCDKKSLKLYQNTTQFQLVYISIILPMFCIFRMN